jgi:hypothetical protein
LPAEKHRNRAIRPDAIKRDAYIVGLDGEGSGRAPHLYTYFAAVGEDGYTVDCENESGLTSLQCLDAIMQIPKRALIVGFALGYDHTQWFKDLPPRTIYRLLHEEMRVKQVKGKRVYKPVRFEQYKLGYMNGRLTVRCGKETRIIWDIWRFFQAAFTKALQQWGIATAEELATMQSMKDARGTATWGTNAEEVKAYCRDECLKITKLMRALLNAHSDAGLSLRDYYGAGSSSSAMLRMMGIRREMAPTPREIMPAVRRAFFGGRFENSVIGSVAGPVYSYDISSAYPYQTAHLPCMKHGTWVHVDKCTNSDIRGSDAALVSWSIPEGSRRTLEHWGPWPVRCKDGSIIYPAAAQGGWIWGNEWLSGLRLSPDAIMREAWLYNTPCECKPFARIVDYYLERLKLGKDGKGLAIKLAVNGVYGKLAQTKGHNPPYQSFVWAGIITSNTRAMLLDVLGSSVLMLATDGVFSTAPLDMPKPRETGTGPSKPLGGWETKTYPSGVFVARPGIYWPMGTTDVSDVKARGVGKAIIRDKRDEIVRAYEAGEPEVIIHGLQRFRGAKDSVSFAPKAGIYRRSPEYGEWLDEEQRISFNVAPKRARVELGGNLTLHGYWPEESAPYSKLVEKRATESGLLIEQESSSLSP